MDEISIKACHCKDSLCDSFISGENCLLYTFSNAGVAAFQGSKREVTYMNTIFPQLYSIIVEWFFFRWRVGIEP